MAKNIDLTNIETLSKLKESLNNVIDGKIALEEHNEQLKKIKDQTLGQLKTLFESISDKLFDQNRNGFGKVVKVLRENKDLNTLYSIYECAVNPKYTECPQILLAELGTIAKTLNENKVREGEKEFAEKLCEAIENTDVTTSEIKEGLNTKKEINESIDYLMFNGTNIKNIHEHVSKLHSAVDYITENMDKEYDGVKFEDEGDEFSATDLDKIETNKLEPWELDVVKDMALCKLSNGNKKDLFDQYKDDCVSKLKDKVENSETVEEAARFNTMKEQLERKEYDETKLHESLLNLSELRYTLDK